ncbi:hypothetical protein EV182_005227, partial [Spiromyces aspiralis]
WHLSEYQSLTLWACSQRALPSTNWASYIRMLPQSFESLPAYALARKYTPRQLLDGFHRNDLLWKLLPRNVQ